MNFFRDQNLSPIREIHGRADEEAQISSHGKYALLKCPTALHFREHFPRCLEQGLPLVVIPCSTPMETEILLRQLPAEPPEEAALVLFTSGTTGEPKAVFHSEKSLLASAKQLALAFPNTGPTISLLSPSSMGGIAFHFLLPLATGSEVLYSIDPFHAWSHEAGEKLFQSKATHAFLNPFLLEMFLRAGNSPWNGRVVSLTAALKKTLAEDWEIRAGKPPLEIYGLTEAAGPVLLQNLSLGAELRLSPENELQIHGEQLFLGYGSRGSFEAASPWFSTGDIFSESFQHQARQRELIDIGGRKVAPRLIEEVMERSEQVQECLAFPVELAGLERVGIFYVTKPGQGGHPERIEKFARENLSERVRPHFWLEVSELPRGKTGKPDRQKAAGLAKLKLS